MTLFGRELTLDEIIGLVECNANPDDDLIHRAALELIAALQDAQRRERAAVESIETALELIEQEDKKHRGKTTNIHFHGGVIYALGYARGVLPDLKKFGHDLQEYEKGDAEAIAAWNRRKPENEPITLDEMNALDHEPIYVLHTGGKWTMNGWHIATASSYQNHGRCDLEIDNGNTIIDMQNYGKTWLAYRAKPERSEGE